ncbi:MAG: hypothetical protein WCH61_00095, partial [bacterium]
SAPAYSRWFSMAHLAKSSVLTNTASGGRQNQWSVFTQALFPWSYDTDTYRLTPTSSDQPRYTLANAGSATVANLTSTSSGIPWLANLSPASVRDQVAANLIDYCDADDIATVPAGFSFSNSTTYVGLEKVPYINEVLITATLIENPGPPVSYSLDLTANCEMINIYDTNKSANFKMEVTFSNTSWQVSGSGVKTIPANFYRESGAYLSTYNPGGSSISLAVNKITVILTNSSTAYSAATVLDYTALETASPTLTLTSSSGTQCISVQVRDPRSNSNYSDGWEWGIWGSTAGTMMFAPYTNTNANPSGRAPNNDLETTGDPASNLSTAYIRNSRMLSLWELGAIHRGEAWRTLNLSKTTTGALSYTYTNGDANILDQVTLSTTATAATTVPIRGRFNVNSPQAEAWACFLTGVSVGQNYGDLSGTGTGTGTALTNANGRAITANANGIFEINGTSTSSSPITNRSGIAKWVGGTTRTTLSNNTVPAAGSQTTDRAQEEIIGKIADLLTVRSNYFTVIVTAQSVKDISAAVAGMTNGKSQADIDVLKASWPKTWIKYYDNDGNYNTDDNDGDWTDGDKWCDVLAEQKILAVVFRDAFTNTFVIKSFEYLNE